MESTIEDKPDKGIEVSHAEATTTSSDIEDQITKEPNHHSKNHLVSHTGGDVAVTGKTWFVIMVCPIRFCLP